MNLKGKSALVTGGASGIGRAIVKKFLGEGARVIALDKDLDGLQSLSRETKSRNLVTLEVNIVHPEFKPQNFEQIPWSKLDILVNNAGIDEPFSWEKKRIDLSLTTFNAIMDVNLRGTMRITDRFVKARRGKKPASVIFITSVHTALAFPNGAAYDASKHGMVGIMRNLALELGPTGLRANAVAPGAIYPTGITRGLSKSKIKEFSGKIPLRRLGAPKDIADVCAFLASDQASYINGAEIRVDGGLAIQNALF
ncbi:MAG: hypothetical protein A2751_03155 [Candidatus Doudnabacteria bacterium RIFCSPHIGHO2_01_FULL_46_14]|uniref:SDR family oxidoreductase n=1 Tax=Candidatus Doudnabacteria bacterium RIFCSPHIGHO2_01_FULL_46_14 TaxID=1817824 RepID=A0A1F5NKG1_9BACT|nr:MAG: hypothetical protein A2751_03155 [Candidatus Doudnabacteria bacterium RIFCSPHIGHO2_01_FULL_46_14]